MRKFVALTSFAAGYVLGARAGRDRYDQIRRIAMRVKDDPRIQETAQSAADKAREQAPVVGQKLAGAAGTVADKAKQAAHIGSNGQGDAGDRLNPESTHFQDNPYPQGDLP
jgi:hypothetical protein